MSQSTATPRNPILRENRQKLLCLVFIAGVALWLGTASGAAASEPATVLSEVPATVTFHEHVESILQRECQGCHRPEGADFGGMRAPMPLVDYGQVRPWAKSIARQVSEGSMPPWFASDHTRGQFQNERRLSEVEKATIIKWVESGAPAGDVNKAPPARSWSDHQGWLIGEPDLVIDLQEPFWVGDDVVDLNISLPAQLITKEMLPRPRYIKAVEFRAGSDIVHHIIASKRAATAETPGASGMIGGIAPGSEPFQFPDGVGRLLVPDTQIYLQMHYNKEPGAGTGLFDRSQMAIKFHPEDAPVREVAQFHGIGNRYFEIPPNAEEWVVGAATTFDEPITIYSYLPHMHLRGQAARYVAHYPDGREELLLHVPSYDWNWQTIYNLKQPKKFPAGTRIEVTMTFTNTEERNKVTSLDIDTGRSVRFNGPTTDEMMIGFIDYSESATPSEGASGSAVATAEVSAAGGGD